MRKFVFTAIVALLAACSPSENPSSLTPIGFESVYTTLDLDKCQTIKTYEDSGGRDMKCAGYRDIPVFVSVQDGRHDIDIGRLDDDFVNAMDFNSLGDTLEWRLYSGEPVSVIARYNFTAPDPVAGEYNRLAVLSIATKDRDSCYIAWISPHMKPNQIIKARAFADNVTADTPCL